MRHIGIIGAGISGLVTAKTFLQKGYYVTVLEKADDIGGVWHESRSYLGVTTQTTRDQYAFSDFPMPSHYPLWPSAEQIREYLMEYAVHFGVLPYIRFGVNVKQLFHDGFSWVVRLDSDERLIFSFVVVCTGTFHEPYVPKIPGMDEFRNAGGLTLHSTEVTDPEMLSGKHVAVVGFAKSATDIATQAADLAKSCTLIYRRAQWMVPQYFGNLINMKYLLFSRFSESMVRGRRRSTLHGIFQIACQPFVWTYWRMVEWLLSWQFGLKRHGMRPTHRIENQISCSLGVEPPGFYKKVGIGQIRGSCTEIDRFEGREVILRNGETIRPDIVIFGTGFRQRLPFLNVKYQEIVTNDHGLYTLYRNILHPDLPQLGFVGFNSSLFTSLTSEVAAHWLASVVSGELILPPAEDMYREIRAIETWRTTGRPVAAEFGGLCVAPFAYRHLDELMRDMGLPGRASWNLIYEFFKPVNPADYRKILMRKRKTF